MLKDFKQYRRVVISEYVLLQLSPFMFTEHISVTVTPKTSVQKIAS